MSASPVGSDDFGTVSYSGNMCDLIRQMLSLEARTGQFVGWVVTSAGRATDGFAVELALIRAGVDGGSTAASYVVTAQPTFTTLFTGARVRFKAFINNNAGSTLNVDGLGAKAMLKRGGIAVDAGDIIGNEIVDFEYDASLNGGLGGWVLMQSPYSELVTIGTEFQVLRTNAAATARENADPIILQVFRQSLSAVDSVTDAGTGIVHYNNTVPTYEDGKEYSSVLFTPVSPNSRIRVEFEGWAGLNGVDWWCMALFQDATLPADLAIAAASTHIDDADTTDQVKIIKEIPSPGTSVVEFQLRFGPGTSGTAYVNRSGSGLKFAGLLESHWTITEYLP